MERLIQGIHQFRQENFRSMEGLFAKLSKSQTPDAMFITCSDSRLDPNLLTRSQPGDLFILRNAGNIIPAGGGEEATVEFAVSALGVRDIIVCGHSHCGAMKGLLQPELLNSMPAVAKWLAADATVQIVHDKYAHLDPDHQLMAATEENVLVQLENIRNFDSVSKRLEKGDLYLHGWVYKFETGEVFVYDPASGQFELATYERKK